ncbi:MAG: PEP-CTERM sorting domain-containing protein [Opitutaceae bacterium]|nr:PEP-CTERM sorting domain-containing protein [Opitutaceae bacterium]
MKPRPGLAVLGLALVFTGLIHAQIVYDPFDYTVGQTLAGQALSGTSAWAALNTGTAPVIATDSLVVPGLATPSGNSVSFAGGNIQEALLSFPAISSGSIYYSFALRLTGLPTAATYTFALATGTSTYGTALWIKPNGSGYQIGVSQRSDLAAVYDSTVYDLNTTLFIVGRHEYVTVPENNDDISGLWINPSSGDYGSAYAPDPTLTSIGGLDRGFTDHFLLRGASGSPAGNFDELRIGTTWASVTPAVPEPAASVLLLGGAATVLVLLRRRRSA